MYVHVDRSSYNSYSIKHAQCVGASLNEPNIVVLASKYMCTCMYIMYMYRNLVIFCVENISYVIISYSFNFVCSPVYENYLTRFFSIRYVLHCHVTRTCEALRTRYGDMKEYEMVCCVRGYRVYQEVWRAVVGEDLACDRETSNERDRYTVAVKKMVA